ncbi:uncharacterized protein BJ171DRAFT_601494 [Polychytrium aggregatum]|uniref:uncharacterized protein n=1 Tax=Polychytrium aggregatum TaxID=110093 RepID=UPI0022FDBE37|nr:uncharacterized protein BJ171DRAFT_601494 [Polychytrium aggregatum]KAI9199794.1 hypothetical protein BJ171DRAFT_601494 [Polychytrium aggregatum]
MTRKTVVEKRRIVQEAYSCKNNIKATARKFKVQPQHIRRWLRQLERIDGYSIKDQSPANVAQDLPNGQPRLSLSSPTDSCSDISGISPMMEQPLYTYGPRASQARSPMPLPEHPIEFQDGPPTFCDIPMPLNSAVLLSGQHPIVLSRIAESQSQLPPQQATQYRPGPLVAELACVPESSAAGSQVLGIGSSMPNPYFLESHTSASYTHIVRSRMYHSYIAEPNVPESYGPPGCLQVIQPSPRFDHYADTAVSYATVVSGRAETIDGATTLEHPALPAAPTLHTALNIPAAPVIRTAFGIPVTTEIHIVTGMLVDSAADAPHSGHHSAPAASVASIGSAHSPRTMSLSQRYPPPTRTACERYSPTLSSVTCELSPNVSASASIQLQHSESSFGQAVGGSFANPSGFGNRDAWHCYFPSASPY